MPTDNSQEQTERDLVKYKFEVDEVWNTAEIERDFTVLAFSAPYIRCIRKSDGVHGSMQFTHDPRYYFDFQEDSP